jgi:hypothetical protein
MRSRLIGLGLIVVLISGFGLANEQTGSSAQDATSPNPIVGAWIITTYVEGQPPAMNLTTFYADGNVLTSNSPVFPPAPGDATAEARSAGQGNWIANDGSIDFVFIVLRADLNGTFSGHREIRGHFTFDAATDTLAGPFTATIVDANGADVRAVSGRGEGTRIVAEPFEMNATPVAS